ncbi:MAG: hypothetical protein ABL953_12855 [Ilumatobacteraceae bacterium]
MNLPPPNTNWAPPSAAVAPPTVEATAKSVLFDTPEQAAAALAAQSDDAVLANVPPVVRKVAQKEMQRAILEVLDIGLVGVVQRGWQNHDGLLAAGKRTAQGGREVVQLADHVINSSHSPSIAIAIDGVELGQLPIAVNMSLKLMGVAAVVERGHLLGVEAGSIAASANLALAGKPITSRTKTVDAARAIQLPKPVPLIS